MNLNETIEGNIQEYCLACLRKNPNMCNLTENIEKRDLFTRFFNVELNKFKEYPHFICDGCETELNKTNNFCQNVRKNLAAIEEYNKNNQAFISHEDELYDEADDDFFGDKNDHKMETKSEMKSEVVIDHTDKIIMVDPNEVDRVIESFRSQFSDNKTCVMCGFIAENRRSISSHMAIFHKEIKNSWCLECNQIYEDFEDHKKSHSNRYPCPFCERKITIPHYVEHLKSHSGAFECKQCNKKFKTAAWLTKHSRIHTDEKPYICPNCFKGFIQLSSLRYHLGTHGNYSCDECKKHYKTEKLLKNHECIPSSSTQIKEIWVKSEGNDNTDIEPAETIIINGVDVVGSGELQNFCKDCNKRVKSLKQHVEKHHRPPDQQAIAQSKRVKCEFCQKTFVDNYKLKGHIKSHTGQLPYKCKYCDRRTLTRSKLKDHERTHTKEKPYICNICGKALAQSSTLRTHMRQHTGRPEVCSICDKTFCRKSQLTLHLSKHMGERPHLCPNCGKTFAQKSHLTEHMTSHTDERPFECSYCDKRFKTNNFLREHLKLHQAHKPFQCPSCPYACHKAYRLQQHMKQHDTDSFEVTGLSESILEGPDLGNEDRSQNS